MTHCIEISASFIWVTCYILGLMTGIIAYRIITKPIDKDAPHYNCTDIRLPPKNTTPMPPIYDRYYVFYRQSNNQCLWFR